VTAAVAGGGGVQPPAICSHRRKMLSASCVV